MNRLESTAPTLWNHISQLPADARTALVLAACKHALNNSGLNDEIILESYFLLVADKALSDKQMEVLKARAEELDEKYLIALQNNSASPEEISMLFKLARAASAISFAATDSTIESAAECIYEASVIDDDEEAYWEALLSNTKS